MRRFIMALMMPTALVHMDVGWPQQKAFADAMLDTTYKYKIVNEDSGLVLVFRPSLSRQAPRRFNGATTAHLTTSAILPVLAVDSTRSYNT